MMNWQKLSLVGALVVVSIVLVGVLGGLMTQKINAFGPLPKSQKPEEPRLTAQLPNPAVDSKLVDANTKFGFKLFKEVLKQDSQKNVFISPTSIAIALSMTYNGASGETQ